MSDPETIAWYQAQTPRHVYSSAIGPSRHLDAFLDRLTPGARILELGCGGGRDAAHMARRGFAVDATDGTPAMVRKARERTGLDVREMRFDQLHSADDYDAVWAHACLLHVRRADLPDILSRIGTALRPGGWHYASFKLAGPENPVEGRDRHGRLHNFPDAGWVESIYREAGFRIEEALVFRGDGADGVVRDWIAVTVRKPN